MNEARVSEGRSGVVSEWTRRTELRGPRDLDRGECGLYRGGWNGGWTFYCGCGFCTPLSKSFGDGMELLERHWERGERPIRRLA